MNFGFTLQAGWEATGMMMGMAFLNGGPAALVWGVVFASFGHVAVALSLGEMASMDPTVGAQYRWSARFARKWPEFWGLMQGKPALYSALYQRAVAECFCSSELHRLKRTFHPAYSMKLHVEISRARLAKILQVG